MGTFSEHHPQSMHMLGMHGAAYANFAIQESDLIVAIGSRFDDRTTGVLNKYPPDASPTSPHLLAILPPSPPPPPSPSPQVRPRGAPRA